MGWVSSHKRHGAGLALVALALQIVLSFGHVHLENFDGARAAHFAGVDGHHAALTQASRQAPVQNPGDADDYCAICASIFLASTSFVAEPPQLPVPVGFERIALTFDADQGMTAPPRYVLFQSRAPPAA